MDSPQLHQLGNVDAPTKSLRSRRSKETRREREFYSYFDSVLANVRTKPQLCDLHHPEAVAAHTAKASVDTTLTAFTQLAALRLQAKRSMIFFFDTDFAYVMAESTQTLALSDDSQHAPGDSLWLGFTKIPRGLSVCEVTTDLPANTGSNARDPRTASIVHIINDMAEDTRYCDRPFVVDGPKARFYAGVPITTPTGVNIGAICVLDDKPRNGLELHEVEFLRNLASSVMSHLELIRAKEDNQRSHNMTTALGAFVEGKSELNEWRYHSAPLRDTTQNAQKLMRPSFESLQSTPPISPPGTSFEDDSHPSQHGYFAPLSPSGLSARPDLAASVPVQAVKSHTIPFLEKSRNMGNTSVDGSHSRIPTSSYTTAPQELGPLAEENNLMAQIKSTVTRAASLVRTGIRADGVIFLDATIGTFGGLVASTQVLSQSETDTDLDRRATVTSRPHPEVEESVNLSTEEEDETKHSVVLGSAHSPNVNARLKDTMHQARVRSKDLKTLLRHYPHGQIWHFNSDGHTSDDDDFSSNSASTFISAADSAHSETGQPPTPSGRRTMRRSRARKRDALLIRKTFPGVRSLMFLGMWDPQQERWFGAAIALSYAPTRIFSTEAELTYLAAFCDVLMGEVWRLEAQELGRAKNQFISSISHELRSPLHGILGAAECLEQQEQDNLKVELIRSITTCGSTLLDVVNDLLDLSGLNQDSRTRRKMRPSKAPKTSPPADSLVMLSTLTEDAVEAACLGHRHKYQHNPIRPRTQRPAIVTLDLELLNASDWLGSSTIGSWKRVCLNLVTNALKYCPKGYISVSLKRTPLEQSSSAAQNASIELVVEDSGIGMTEEFQTRGLFRPFQQEDNLSPGTGLGLNLVAQIVRSLNGTVHVKSSKGVGTTVKVTLPSRCMTEESWSLSAASVAEPFNATFVGFTVDEADSQTGSKEADADRRLLASLDKCCRQIGGTVSASDSVNVEAGILVVREQRLRTLFESKGQSTRRSWLELDPAMRPVVAICNTQASALALQSGPMASHFPSRSQFLWLPIGPAKLAAAVSTILKSEPNSSCNLVECLDMSDPTPIALSAFNNTTGRSSYFGKSEGATADVRDGVEGLSIRGPACEPASGETVDQPIHQGEYAGPNEDLILPEEQAGSTRLNQGAMPSLLLVEDNAINLKLLEVFAKRAGHQYYTARDGKEAVECYEKAARAIVPHCSDSSTPNSKPDIVLMDLNMPVMNGFQATRAIRRFEVNNNVPRATIIAVTGLGDVTAHDEAFESGMDLFLTKPVRMKELAEIISSIRKRSACGEQE